MVYIDWPGWAGRAQEEREERGAGANRLPLSTDQKTYTVGETARVQLPAMAHRRILVSVENGSQVLSYDWFDLDEGQTSFPVPITVDMAPNVYVSVALLQPHANKNNDRPIRLFGVVPIMVDDPSTHVSPQLEVPDEVESHTPLTIHVSEQTGRPMTYTLAVVDEGLLGLTNYKTPDLHQAFYAREALGVLTWDVFDKVVGAYGGALERLLALGGDASAEENDTHTQKKRFPPVVRFLGAFRLAAAETRQHTITLPEYMGAVRVMLVAGQDGAYGKAEATILVRQPLSILATLPRVLGPNETVSLPVNVFVTQADIIHVEVQIETDKTDDRFDVVTPRATLSFPQPGDAGDAIVQFSLKVDDILGTGTVRGLAQSGVYQTQQTIHIKVRSPNPPSLMHTTHVLPAGETWQHTFTPHGVAGTNETVLEISSVPPLNLEHRLQYLMQFPHGCLEQTTSAVFPQLYLKNLVNLSDTQQQEIEHNVKTGVERLRGFQRGDGGFSYWPGDSQAHAWGTSYAGHFLLEARRLGYPIPQKTIDNWVQYQRGQAGTFVMEPEQTGLDQAYRLYTLTLANAAELGAMNRLRENPGLDNITRWQLAGAYQHIGLSNAARALIQISDLSLPSYTREGRTLGSTLRDQALILSVLNDMEHFQQRQTLTESVSAALAA